MFTLPDLPYDYNALEPHIDEATMRLHHTKHHQTYVDKLNAATEGTDYADRSVESLIKDLGALPSNIQTVVRNNGGGHYNHSFFWKVMSPTGGGNPGGKLAQLIDASFGSFEEFKNDFADAAVDRFGSGWVWLIQDGDVLRITSSPNQDSPLMDDGIEPLLALDVWEHAYYLQYKNKRPDYVQAWWNVVDWGQVASRLHA